jgi:adenylosuccinate synthase
MTTTRRMAVLGAQWGDEGKGKIINYFAPQFDWVVRFSGGPNAGHTIYFQGRKLVHHVLPSIHVESNSRGFLGSAMVLDLEKLEKEVAKFEAEFPGFGARFTIDPDAFLILPWHRQEDELLEARRKNFIGTTKRGIGPAYADKIARRGVRLGDVTRPELRGLLHELFDLKRSLYGDGITGSPAEVEAALIREYEALMRFGLSVRGTIELRDDFAKSSILYEGAQGMLLDVECGTYPYVTSALCGVAGIHACGFGTTAPTAVHGVIKAYCTRVGEGPFPSELFGDQAERIREAGGEFGATTGRPRRIGWLDLPALRYAAAKGAITHWVVTKQDVLNGRGGVSVCTGYEVAGRVLEAPRVPGDFQTAKPILKEMAGWSDRNDANFQRFLDFLVGETGVPCSYISFGPGTADIAGV